MCNSGTGRLRSGGSIQQWPATGAHAAMVPESSAAIRNARDAPLENPLRKIRRRSSECSVTMRSISVAMNPTSSTCWRAT